MRRTIFALAVLAMLTGAPASVQAGLIFYATRADFTAANPGLPVETFSAANVAAGKFTLISPPLWSMTDDGVFSPGSILPGLSVDTSFGGLMVVLGDGTVTGTTKSVGNNSITTSLILGFPPGVFSVGFDVFAAPTTGPTIAETFEISVFAPFRLLGTTTVSETAGSITFLGVSSDVAITAISLHDQANNASTFVDNVAFGAVPEPSSLALGALAACAMLTWTARARFRGKPAQAQAAE